MRDRDFLFEVNMVLTGPHGGQIFYGKPYRPHRITVSNRGQAYEFAKTVCDRLLSENNFKMAKVAYVRDLTTGRFV